LKYLLIIILATSLNFSFAQLDTDSEIHRITLGFNLHRLGIRSPMYLGYENIRAGYWFHQFHQAGLEAGMLRANIASPIVGPYYRFQALEGRFHPFFEGSAKVLFIRNSALERSRSLVIAGYGGLNLSLSDRFSVEAAVGKSNIDWDTYIGMNYRF